MDLDKKNKLAAECLHRIGNIIVEDLDSYSEDPALFLELTYAVSKGLTEAVLKTCNKHLSDIDKEKIRLEMIAVINDYLKGDKNE